MCERKFEGQHPFPSSELTERMVARRCRWENSFGKNTVEETGTNVSDIMSRMVHEAARVCDYHAGDIFYDMKDLETAVENRTGLCVVLAMTKSGVRTYRAGYVDGELYVMLNEDNARIPSLMLGIQLWLLQHTPDQTPANPKSHTLFRRVEVCSDFLCGKDMK